MRPPAMPSCVSTVTARRSWSSAVARPSSSSERGHIILSGTTMWRGSSVPEAASGKSGVNSMKFSGQTIVVSSPALAEQSCHPAAGEAAAEDQRPAVRPSLVRSHRLRIIGRRGSRGGGHQKARPRRLWVAFVDPLPNRVFFDCGIVAGLRDAFDERITALFPLHPKHIDPWRDQLDGAARWSRRPTLMHLRVPLGRADRPARRHLPRRPRGLSHARRAHEPPPRLQQGAVGARPSHRLPRHRPRGAPAALGRRRPRDVGLALLRPAVRAGAAARGDACRLRRACRDEPPGARLDAVPRRCAPAGRAGRRLRRVLGSHGGEGRRLAAPRPLRRAERDHALRPRPLPRHRPGEDHDHRLAADGRLPPSAAAGGLRGAPAALRPRPGQAADPVRRQHA